MRNVIVFEGTNYDVAEGETVESFRGIITGLVAGIGTATLTKTETQGDVTYHYYARPTADKGC